jgi:hypothetical protein
MATVDNALKNFYIEPIRDNLRLATDPLIARILQDTSHIVGAQKIIRAVRTGVSGGVGAGTETGALPSAGDVKFIQLETDTKNLYGSIELSDKVMKAVKGPNAGSFIDVLDTEMNGMLATARWYMGRQVYGDGNGSLMVCKANAVEGKVVDPATGDSPRFLLPGLKVDLVKAADGTTYEGKGGMRITDVDWKTGKVTLDTAVTITAGDMLVIQGSYGLEMTGLGKIFETLSGTEEIYGLKRADYAWLRPYLDSNFGAIDEVKLGDVINALEDHWKVNINHINCGNDAYNYYLELMNQRRAINDVMTLEGGHKALKFNGMPLVRNPHLLDAEIDMLDTSLFTVEMISDWDWIEGPTGGVLNQKAGYPTYVGSITKYCNLVCEMPGGCAKLTGVAQPAA